MKSKDRLLHPLSHFAGRELPAHMQGTRAAIFHLLRTASESQQFIRPRRPVPAAAVQTSPVRVRTHEQSQTVLPQDPGWQAFFEEDQFEFHSRETMKVAVQSYVAGVARSASS